MVPGSYRRTRDRPPCLKRQRKITRSQKIVPACPSTPDKGNSALLKERTLMGRRPHLPCPFRWICAPRRIMATSKMRRFENEFLLYAPAGHRSRAGMARPWREAAPFSSLSILRLRRSSGRQADQRSLERRRRDHAGPDSRRPHRPSHASSPTFAVAPPRAVSASPPSTCTRGCSRPAGRAATPRAPSGLGRTHPLA